MNEISDYNEFIGNKMIIYQLKNWWESYKNNKKKNIVLITGISGIGKTLLVNLFCKFNDIEIKEFSYFDSKNFNNYKERLEEIYSFQNILELMYQKKTAILIDDIDSYVSDKKKINDIIKIIYNGKINKLTFIISKINLDKQYSKKNNIEILNFKKPSFNDIENYIYDYSLQNKFIINNETVKYIYDITNSDIRIINQLLKNLTSYVYVKKKNDNIKFDKYIKIDDKYINVLLSLKDIDYQLYEIIIKIFFVKNSMNDNINYLLSDTYFLPTILYDNLETLLNNKKNGLNEYLYIMNNIIIAEHINDKTFKYQNNLSFEYYSFLYSCSINLITYKYDKISIKYSILMNKLLKINNSIKFLSNVILKLPKEIKIESLSKIVTIYEYINKKNNIKNNFVNYLDNIQIEYDKLLKYI